MLDFLLILIDSFAYMAQMMTTFLEYPLSFLDTLSHWAESLDFVGFISVPIDILSGVLSFFSGILELFAEILNIWEQDLNPPLEIFTKDPQEII